MSDRTPSQVTFRAIRPTALLRSDAFTGHDTGPHPENPGRITAIERELQHRDLLSGRTDVPFEPADDEAITRVHTRHHVANLEAIAAAGGGWIDADTMVAPDSLNVVRLAAGAGIAAVDALLDTDLGHAFVLARPPGHHATPERAMGFCLLNTAAIAAVHALHRGRERVAIVDWDVHHGNGTQDAFYATDQVLYCSLHQWPLYPGTGAASERGTGPGTGYTMNIPLAPSSGDAEVVHAVEDRILPALRDYRPQLLIVSAGFDAHTRDPLANLSVTEQGFRTIAHLLASAASELCDGRLLAILEGGYDLTALANSVVAVIEALDTTVPA